MDLLRLPLRATNSYITHFLLARHIFLAQYPKRHRTSSHCGPFEASPKSYQFLHNTFSPSQAYFFWLNTLKGTAQAPTVDLLRLNTRRGTRTAFLTAKRYNEHPRHIYRGVPPPRKLWSTFPDSRRFTHRTIMKFFITWSAMGATAWKKKPFQQTSGITSIIM